MKVFVDQFLEIAQRSDGAIIVEGQHLKLPVYRRD